MSAQKEQRGLAAYTRGYARSNYNSHDTTHTKAPKWDGLCKGGCGTLLRGTNLGLPAAPVVCSLACLNTYTHQALARRES
jgi:hypothetical protein